MHKDISKSTYVSIFQNVEEIFPFWQAVSDLKYLMCGTPPDLAYEVGSRLLGNPSKQDMRLKRVFHYLSSIIGIRITQKYGTNDGIIQWYSDV